MNWIAHDPEERLQKKLCRIGRSSAWSAGIGAGMLLVQLFFSEPSQHKINAVFLEAGAAFLTCGVIQLLFLMFARKHAPKVNMLMTWVILPAALIKVTMDYLS